MVKEKIRIYKGPGVGAFSLSQTLNMCSSMFDQNYQIFCITCEELACTAWEKDTVLLVIPGGADVPYTKALTGKANQKIKTYVLEGGRYMGICAGAYYAGNQVIFDQSGPLEIIEKRELCFFRGNVIGPIFPFSYKTYAGARAIEIMLPKKKESISLFYNGGGYFENAQLFSEVEIIGNYIKGDFPAMIFITYGKGRVLLSGVHFEYNPMLLNHEDGFLKKLIPMLKIFEKQRQELVHKLFARLF